jgi:hypothetical protein
LRGFRFVGHGLSLSSFLDNIARRWRCWCWEFPAARQQQNMPILQHAHERTHVDWARVAIVELILVLALATTLTVNMRFPRPADHFLFLGAAAVWLAIFLSVAARRPDWEVLPEAPKDRFSCAR